MLSWPHAGRLARPTPRPNPHLLLHPPVRHKSATNENEWTPMGRRQPVPFLYFQIYMCQFVFIRGHFIKERAKISTKLATIRRACGADLQGSSQSGELRGAKKVFWSKKQSVYVVQLVIPRRLVKRSSNYRLYWSSHGLKTIAATTAKITQVGAAFSAKPPRHSVPIRRDVSYSMAST